MNGITTRGMYMGNTATLQKAVCEECGLPASEWKGNHGRGIRERAGRACCLNCAEGLGCNCKETGVKRQVVVIDESRTAVVKKIDRHMKAWQSKIKSIQDGGRPKKK